MEIFDLQLQAETQILMLLSKHDKWLQARYS